MTKEFDYNQTGMSMYDDVLKDDFYALRKQRLPETVLMSPDEYIQAASEGFTQNYKQSGYDKKVTPNDLIEQRSKGLQNLLDKGFGTKQFDMPILEYTKDASGKIYMNQEGLHRAILAKQMGVNDIPVTIYASGAYGDNISNEQLKDLLETKSSKYFRPSKVNTPYLNTLQADELIDIIKTPALRGIALNILEKGSLPLDILGTMYEYSNLNPANKDNYKNPIIQRGVGYME